jgi:AraC-like DNA-binding protein/mannose-6-phosphate isomerase-like protein (cupin superfamily)
VSAAGPARGVWTYWRPSDEAIVELGTVSGREVGLPMHFHDQHQFTFVLAGKRRFFIRDRLVVVAPGKGAWLPAGMPHASAGESSGLVCVNVYVPADQYDVAAFLRRVELAWRKDGRLHPADLAGLVQRHRLAPSSQATPALINALHQHLSVAAAADEVGMSREGYSRLFKARHGMAPAAYRRVMHLNAARALLRAGEEIASAAAQAGFADQSHMGRWFQRIFGVTPGRYRRGLDQSQTF